MQFHHYFSGCQTFFQTAIVTLTDTLDLYVTVVQLFRKTGKGFSASLWKVWNLLSAFRVGFSVEPGSFGLHCWNLMAILFKLPLNSVQIQISNHHQPKKWTVELSMLNLIVLKMRSSFQSLLLVLMWRKNVLIPNRQHIYIEAVTCIVVIE